MRIETFFPQPTPGWTQWYINCAQVDVRGPGGGKSIPYLQDTLIKCLILD